MIADWRRMREALENISKCRKNYSPDTVDAMRQIAEAILAETSVKSDYIAGYRAALAGAAKASWDAINQQWPDGTMHDAQEVANTAIRKLGEQ